MLTTASQAASLKHSFYVAKENKRLLPAGLVEKSAPSLSIPTSYSCPAYTGWKSFVFPMSHSASGPQAPGDSASCQLTGVIPASCHKARDSFQILLKEFWGNFGDALNKFLISEANTYFLACTLGLTWLQNHFVDLPWSVQTACQGRVSYLASFLNGL